MPLAFIVFLEGSGRPDNSLPGGPPLYPSHGLPWAPALPGHDLPMPPVDPGWGVRPPVDPGYGRPSWGPVDPGFGAGRPPVDPGYGRPGYGGGYPSHGLPNAPVYPSQGLPVYPSTGPVPPGVPGQPPVAGQLPAAPPGWIFVFVPGLGWTWAQLPTPPSGENKPVVPEEPTAEPKPA
jgi:hypothetical protein